MIGRRQLVLATGREALAGGNRGTSAHEAPDVLFARPAWHQEAACRGTMVDGRSMWFPDNSEPAKAAEAKRICATCPVRVECSEAGGDQFGIWGQETRRQRARGRVDYRYNQQRADNAAKAVRDKLTGRFAKGAESC